MGGGCMKGNTEGHRRAPGDQPGKGGVCAGEPMVSATWHSGDFGVQQNEDAAMGCGL